MSDEGVQVCTRCGVTLTDYRGAMVPEGTPPLRGFEVGAHIAVESLGGGATAKWAAEEPPDCEPIH